MRDGNMYNYELTDNALEKLDQKAEKLPDSFDVGRFEGGLS
jgi:hypothetical protein